MHKRAEIKAAVKAILLDKTNAQDRVDTNRFSPFGEEDVPFISVYCGNEPVDKIDNITERRTLELVVECIASGHDVDDQLDDLTAQVEHVMIQDMTLGGTVHEIVLTRTEHGYDEESKTTIQSGRLTFSAVYFVDAVADPPTDSLETTEIQYNGGDFADQVTLPQ